MQNIKIGENKMNNKIIMAVALLGTAFGADSDVGALT